MVVLDALARNYECGEMYDTPYGCNHGMYHGEYGGKDGFCIARKSENNDWVSTLSQYDTRLGDKKQSIRIESFVCGGAKTCASEFGTTYPGASDLTYAQCRGLFVSCGGQSGGSLCSTILGWLPPDYGPGSVFATRVEPGYNATRFCQQEGKTTSNYHHVVWSSSSNYPNCTKEDRVFCDISSVTDSTTCASDPADLIWSATAQTNISISMASANLTVAVKASEYNASEWYA